MPSSISPGTKLPDGPKGRVIPTLRFMKEPRRLLEEWRGRYGDPFLVNALNGPIVMTGREELIRAIYGADPDVHYEASPTETMTPILGAGSIFMMNGAAHRRERRLLMPMFHGDRMRSYGKSMCERAYRCAERRLGTPSVEQLPMMIDISFAIIVESIFGGSDPAQIDRLVQASEKMVASLSPILFFTKLSHFSFGGILPWDRMVRAKAELHREFDQLIDERQGAGGSDDDILSMLSSATYEDGEPISREHVRDELMSFLFAGHETTALSLTWGMYHLHRHPQVLARLLEELDGIEDGDPVGLQSAPYLKACIQETLRVHPIVTETLRKLKAPLSLGEYVIPPGVIVSPVTVLAHYNPDTYPDPERFMPERFVDRSYSPFQFMPFGGGHRRCLGAAFATYEMAMVLGTLLKHFRFELLESKEVVPKRRSVTMGPSSKVPMRMVRRK